MVGRVANEVVLKADEHDFLEAQVRRHKAARSLSDRFRMVLLYAEGLQSKEVGARLARRNLDRDRRLVDIKPDQRAILPQT